MRTQKISANELTQSDYVMTTDGQSLEKIEHVDYNGENFMVTTATRYLAYGEYDLVTCAPRPADW